MSNLTLEDLPNPFTPLAFLSPELAYQKTVTTYVAVGALGVLIWDIITHIPADWKMITGTKFGLPNGVYLWSRTSTLTHALTNVIFETAPVKKCAVLTRISSTAYHIALSSTAFLFFLRVRAVFGRNKYITIAFFIMWLSVLAGSMTLIVRLSGSHIGPTEYCAISDFKPFGGSASITVCIFDTAVFGAITWRLLSEAPPVPEGSRSRGKFGLFLPKFSRALLQDGQNYYMVAMISNLLVLAMNYAGGIPTVYRTMFLVPTVGLTNIIACRVFRNAKSGRYDASPTTVQVSLAFAHRSEQLETGTTAFGNTNLTYSSGYSTKKTTAAKEEDVPV